MGEKLNAFTQFYAEKATADVVKWKGLLAESEEKFKKISTELYPAALAAATGFGEQAKADFLKAFPEPGVFYETNLTEYTNLLGLDDGLKKQLQELFKLRRVKGQVKSRKDEVTYSESFVQKGGEDYISRLSHEIFSKAADAASRGANFDTIMTSLFKSYEDYTGFLEDLIDHVPGPEKVLTSPETYAALLEKKEGGAFTLSKKPAGEASPAGSEQKPATSSPINTEEKPKSSTPSGESKPGESSAINTSTEKKNESTSVTSTEGQVTSKPGELTKEEPKTEGKVSTAINVNLETVGSSGSGTDGKGTVSTKPESSQTVNTKVDEPKSPGAINAKVEEAKSPGAINTKVEEIKSPGSISSEKEKIESNTILNANNTVEKSEKILQTEKTAESTDVKSTVSSVNTENTKTQENSTNVEKTSSNTNEGVVNSPKEEKKKGGFLSKLGKISNAVGSALNLPTFKELGSQAAGLFGATGAKFMSNVSDISQSFSKNSINSNTTQKQETSDDTTANTSNSTTNTSVGDSQTTTMNLEKNSPTVSVENKTTTNLDQSNTSGGQVNSTSMSTVTASNPTSNQTILSPQAPANQPPSSNPQNMGSSSGTSVDLSGLAQSISRLEKILISGIEVTIKDT